ncbi:hypothetical protein A2U01_0084334, partial [Trifolium medium]|nr:hypothetical protein [Trifolium medium]
MAPPPGPSQNMAQPDANTANAPTVEKEGDPTLM